VLRSSCEWEKSIEYLTNGDDRFTVLPH